MADSKKTLEERLREAGPRPAPSPERAERVRRAVKAEWRSQVQSRRRGRILQKRIVWSSLAAAAVIAVVFLLRGFGGSPALPKAPASIGEVAAVHGTAWTQPGVALERNDTIVTGGALRTASDSQIAVTLAGGGSVRLSADAVLRPLGARRFALDRGAIYVDSKRMDGSETRSLEIVTPLGTTRNLGTQFEVRLQSESMRVRVRSGRVVVTDGDDSIEVGASEQIEIGTGGHAIRGRIAPDAADWRWIDRVVPPMDIEGRRLDTFLLWVAREKGWRLQTENSGGASDPATIELNGTIEGMTLEQALDSVMLTSRWQYRLEGDLLIVSPMDS